MSPPTSATTVFRMNLRSAVFQISRQCPLECGHCYISASPRHRQRLNIENLVEALSAIKKQSPDCVIGFTGGDPFVNLAYLKRASREAKLRNFLITINTSAFFAKTKSAALRVLRQVAVDVLEVSIDRYHLEFQSIEKTRNCVIAAQELGIEVVIHTLEDDLEDTKSDLSKLVNHFSKRGVRLSKSPLFVKKGASIESISHDLGQSCSYAFKIVVDEVGDVFPCCNGQLIGVLDHVGKEGFVWGNILESSPSEVFEKIQSSRILEIVHAFGPYAACKVAEIPAEGRSYCGACAAACERQDSMNRNIFSALMAVS